MTRDEARAIAQKTLDAHLDIEGLRERLAEQLIQSSPQGQSDAKTILDTPMPRNDADAFTVRDYLKALLITLLTERERFGGKRPFGNSGWEHDLLAALIKPGLVDGELDEYGHVNKGDTDEAMAMIIGAVRTL